ncbi:HNH endonuclease [Oleiharenicola lentus]|uniref:HNH endonuclease n=1 Tax=Oleiharenicola lentus TaxID=2508720 RepID=A0A4Q1C5J1_9BACT|nr:HNH endonuclease [Oleiharenicola lentus]
MNRWNIPAYLEIEISGRDARCIYCQVDFSTSTGGRGVTPSWEHIINDASIITRENIARCCVSCNASKGVKSLGVWIDSAYCKRKGITSETISQVAKNALLKERLS